MTYFEDGLLPSAFLVGLLIASPIFAEASKTCNAFRRVHNLSGIVILSTLLALRLQALGMGIWIVACLGCAAAPNFPVLLACRMIVGVGEASFVSLAAPFIDDWAPVKSKSSWFATFYCCIPTGFALGIISGGQVGKIEVDHALSLFIKFPAKSDRKSIGLEMGFCD